MALSEPQHIKQEKDKSADCTDQVHAQFNDADADIILRSSDSVVFRIHSLVLRLASGWFRALLTLPQGLPSSELNSSLEVINVTETEQVVAGLLSVATGQILPALDAIDYVDDLLRAAEKYDMPSVISIVRLAVISPPLLDAHPIRVYAIATRWGWTAEAKLASTKTLTSDLLSPEAITDLRTVESSHLVSLMLLHRRRRDMLRAGLDDPAEFTANIYPEKCVHCQEDMTHHAWAHLKYAWIHAAEASPASIAFTAGLLEDVHLKEVLAAKCPHCEGQLYAVEATLASLSAVFDNLPTVVEVSASYASTWPDLMSSFAQLE